VCDKKIKKKRKKLKRYGKFWVYILRCCDNTYYTGYTPNLKQRVAKHRAGKGAKYTRTRLPVKLAWCKKYRYFKNAFLEEIRIKRLKRKQKEKLMGKKSSKRKKISN
jgi:putative endonuclease